MENSIESNEETKQFILDNHALNHLRQTRKWTMFLSIVGFVFIGIMLIAFIFVLGKGRGFGIVTLPAFTVFPMLLLMAVYFFPIYFLYQFSNFSKQALEKSDTGFLSTAFRYLKMHYTFMGVLFIVLMSIYLIIALVAISAGSFLNMF